jgi:hypothetical protein
MLSVTGEWWTGQLVRGYHEPVCGEIRAPRSDGLRKSA